MTHSWLQRDTWNGKSPARLELPHLCQFRLDGPRRCGHERFHSPASGVTASMGRPPIGCPPTATPPVTWKSDFIRRLDWAMYMVDDSGRNPGTRRPRELAPSPKNHFLRATTATRHIQYPTTGIPYEKSQPNLWKFSA